MIRKKRQQHAHMATVNVNPDGEPRTVLWCGKEQPVKRLVDRWHIDLAWATGDLGREYIVIELMNRTQLELCRNLNTGTWTVQGVKEHWFRLPGRPSAPCHR